jgi:cellulose synthase/poly-beta-1,6-N-acetylglucosamine synthase-like glycosyltransferase
LCYDIWAGIYDDGLKLACFKACGLLDWVIRMVRVYYYISRKEAATAVECGLKLSEWFDRKTTFGSNEKRFIAMYQKPQDDMHKFLSSDFACLEIEISEAHCHMADRLLYNGMSVNRQHNMESYAGSIIPYDRYLEGMYRYPEYLVSATIMPEQVVVINRGLLSAKEALERQVKVSREKTADTFMPQKKSGLKFGEHLLQNKLITEEQLELALKVQAERGGRLGDVLVSLGLVTRQLLDVNSVETGEKRRLGEMLADNGLITGEQLEHALAFQRKSGGPLGEILLSLNYLTAEELYRAIATQGSMGRIGHRNNFDEALKIPYEVAKKDNAVLVNNMPDRYLVAVTSKLDDKNKKEIGSYLDKPLEQVLASQSEIDAFLEMVYNSNMNDESINKLLNEQPENSAVQTFTKLQKLTGFAILLVMAALIADSPMKVLTVLNIIIQVIYFSLAVFKISILLTGTKNAAQIRLKENEIADIDEKDLPVYTILVPMYREKEVVPSLIKSIEDLDYPKHKLDVRLLLEEDDVETQEAIASMKLPAYYSAVIVPHSLPKTKPKACNYGIIRARGKYTVIFDAEDRPDRDQLKKVYLAFKRLPEEYACIQSKLNYFNNGQNILTKWFTQEYSMWFEILLPGLMKLDIPLPLGGTSNHFKTAVLKEVDAWDPYNVTEDADLGVRLYKKGYKTAVIDSRTWEEANSHLGNWVRQRSRWVKGYMQTWLVHMRNPLSLIKELGVRGFMGFQVMVFGTPFLPLINPFYWLMLVLWYMTKEGWIMTLFPGFVYYLALVEFLLGNFLFVYSNVVGMHFVIEEIADKKTGIFSYSIIKHAILTPIYWFFMSLASYKAAWQLIAKPFYWEKTRHGLPGSTTQNL